MKSVISLLIILSVCEINSHGNVLKLIKFELFMSKEQFILLEKISEKLSDLIYLNGIIATELIKITENTATIRRGEEFLDKTSCPSEHYELNEKIINTLKKYTKKPGDLAGLEKHVLKHIE